MPRQLDLTPQNLKVEFDPTKTLGVTLDQIINTFLSNPVVEALKAIFQTLIDALNPVDWLNPADIILGFQALIQAAKNLIQWSRKWIEELFNLFGLQQVTLPTWLKDLQTLFDLINLQNVYQAFVSAWGAIDWTSWTEIPADLYQAWMGAWNFLKGVWQWILQLWTNFTGYDLMDAFDAFDPKDLQAAWHKFFAAMQAINWLSLDGWFKAGAATVELIYDLINWAVVVIHNIGQIDLTGLINALALNVIADALDTYLETLGTINWTLIGTFEPTGALWQFIKATIVFLQALGNWILEVLHNLLGIVTDVIHQMFSSVSGFITTIIGYVFGDAGAQAWQDALNVITGVTGAAPWDAAISIYNNFLFTANNIIDTVVNTFLGLGGGGFSVNDLLRAIESIPSKFLTGTMLPGQMSLINVGTLSSLLPQFLVNPSFDTPDSILGQGLWTWDGTQGPAGLATSVFTDATGLLKELLSNNISATVGQTFNISGWTQWSGFTGAANSIALTVAQFDAHYNLLGYDLIGAIASPGASSIWTQLANTAYTVPASPPGIAILQLRPIVTELATAGRVWFGGMNVTPVATTLAAPLVPLLDASKIGTGQFAQNMVNNLVTDLSTLTTGVNAAALQTDLQNTWNTIISTLGGTGTGLSGIAAALAAIPGANIAGTINSIAVNVQGLIDAILSAGNPSYVAGSGTLSSVTTMLANLPQANVANLVTALSSKALATDLTNLMSTLGLGTATLTAITNRLANLTATGTMPQAAITGLVAALNATALESDLTALMNNLGAGNPTLAAITTRLSNITGAGIYNANLPITQIINLSGFLTNLNSSGVLSGVTAVNGLSAYLTHLNATTGILSGITAVAGLSGFLTNLNSSGVLNAASGLGGLIPIGNVPTASLTRANIADLGNVYTTINTTVGSGGIMRRTNTGFVSLACNPMTGTQIGPLVLPTSFFDSDEVAPSADLTRSWSAGSYQVSLAGWYRCDICLQVNPQPSAIWNICPVLFVNGTAAKYGNDSISWWQSLTGGVTPRFIQSSFEIYLQVNDTVAAGYDAQGSGTTTTLNNVLTGSDGRRCYFSISLENRSLT